jgi:hypothetical protein
MPKGIQFKTDTAELVQWLSKRKISLEKARTPMEAVWKDIRLYFEPYLGKALIEGDPNQRTADRDDELILNSTSRIALGRMAAGLQSGITNQSRQWFKLNSLDQKAKEMSAVRTWLDETTETCSGILNRSNAYPALDQIYKHLGEFGTAAGVVYADEETDLHIYIADCGSYWLAENRRGRVETMLYLRQMSLVQIRDEFGEDSLPAQFKERIKRGEEESIEKVYCHICRNDPKRIKDADSTRPFVSIYYLDSHKDNGADGILAIRSFSYNPIIAPRWEVYDSVYGVGCAHHGLGDAKQLQKLEEDKLRVVELEVDPPMLVPDSMKLEAVDTGPGGITYYREMGGGGKPTVGRLFETNSQLQPVLLAIQDTEARLSRTFYSDLFAMMINLQTQPKQMTAREVNELSGEKVSLLGPILTRMNSDLLDPLIDAVFAIAIENGLIKDAPPILKGKPLRVEYVSSLHVEQAATTRLSGLYRIAEFAAGIAKFNPNIVDKLDTDQMVDIAATSLTENGVVRDDEDVAKIRQARDEQQQKMMQQEMQAKYAPAMAKAAKDLSQTPVGEGNALEAIAAGGQQ